MKVDLHVHSSERSICSKATEHELIRAAIAAGLDGLAFTDHDRLVPAQRLAELNRSFAPFKIFGGVEITLHDDEHIVVLGIQDGELESRSWSYTRLWHFVRQNGGFMTLAHPFRFHDSIQVPIDRYPPDGIEVYSTNTLPENELRIREIAGRLGIKPMGNSDAHTTRHIGPYYNLLSHQPGTEAELLLALRNGSQAVCSKE
jgi:predicted metal-dependent phosphoesterase TrpH